MEFIFEAFAFVLKLLEDGLNQVLCHGVILALISNKSAHGRRRIWKWYHFRRKHEHASLEPIILG